MPPLQAPLWTTSRRLMGNLAPLAVIGPCLGVTLFEVVLNGLGPRGWIYIGATLVLGWLSVNFAGLTGNSKLKREMSRRLHEERPFDTRTKWFVGFARPKFKGLLDPHEDIGFLILEDDKIIFWGETRKVDLHRDQIVRVHTRPNIHTLIGLGRWVAVEAVLDGAPARLLVEPREKWYLIGNLLLSGPMSRRIAEWARKTDEPSK